MPREPRSFEPGLTYHLISRFIERRWFVTKPQERACYLELQGRALARTDWRLIGYAIMSNHIHLAAIAGRQALDSWLRPVHAPFADMLNEAHQRIGPVFVRGPKAYPVVNARVKLLAYIHNNPVRGICDAAAVRVRAARLPAASPHARAPRRSQLRIVRVDGERRQGLEG